MSIASIVPIGPDPTKAFRPSLDDYASATPGWTETEYRSFEVAQRSFGGFWTGEPGEVAFDSWPYNEICVITKGRVAVVDAEGARREFAAGESFFIPAGFAGRWVTVEPSEKIFVAITAAAT